MLVTARSSCCDKRGDLLNSLICILARARTHIYTRIEREKEDNSHVKRADELKAAAVKKQSDMSDPFFDFDSVRTFYLWILVFAFHP